MSVMFTATAVNADFLSRRMSAAVSGLRTAAETLERELVGRARQKASGEVLQVHTGRHVAAIQGHIEMRGDSVDGVVTSDAPGAGALEYGGTIPAREIRPHGEALRFALGGGAAETFAKAVHLPAVTIRPHSVLGSSLTEMHGSIVDRLKAAVLGALKE